MPNSSNPLGAAAGAMVALFGLMFVITPVAVLLGSSDLGATRPFYLVAALAGASMLFGGVRMIVAWRRGERQEREHRSAIRAAVGQPPPRPAPGTDMAAAAPVGTAEALAPAAPAAAARGEGEAPRRLASGEPVLAHWTYTADEWRAYTAAEWRYRLWEAALVGGGIAVLGWFIVRGEMGAGALPFALGFGAIFFVGRLMVARSAKQANQSGPGEATITPTAILLNGKYHLLAGDQFRFGGVRIDTTRQPRVLEFTVRWNTRHGETNEQIRVPIPAGREAEAQGVVAAFGQGWAVEAQGSA